MLLMMDQHPQRGWRSRTRVLCAPRSGRRSLTATAAEGTRASAPSLLAATACREGRPFIMRGPNQIWREAAAHQRVGRRAKTAAARSRAPSRCVAPFFASSVGSSPRRICGRSRSERHGCPHSRRIYAAQIDDFFCPSFKGWSATK